MMKNFTTLLLFLFIACSMNAQSTKVYWHQNFDSTEWKTSVNDSNLCAPDQLPEGWLVYDSLQSDFFWHWSLSGPRGHFVSGGQTAFEPNNSVIPDFPTKSNGFLLFEADLFNTKPNGQSVDIYQNMNSYIQFGPIGLSNTQSPLIELYLSYYLCCANNENRLSLEVSSDYRSQNPLLVYWKMIN